MNAALCWICHAPADSGEHMVKASDFRLVFPGVNHLDPVFKNSLVHRNVPIKGANADALKFAPSICQHCNNARTQPHDRAWEALSRAIRSMRPLLPGARLPLEPAFGATAKASMLGVHLYFLKLLGCYAVENRIPLPTKHFAVAILAGKPHPNVYLGFVAVPTRAGREDIFVGDIDAINRGAQTVSAVWFYVLGAVGVHVAYSEPGHPPLAQYRGWHPDDVGLNIRMR